MIPVTSNSKMFT